MRKVVHPNAQERADGRAPDCEVGTGVMLEHVPSVAIQANWLEKEPQDEEDPGVYCCADGYRFQVICVKVRDM